MLVKLNTSFEQMMTLVLSCFLARQNSASLAFLRLDNFWAFWLSCVQNCPCCTISIKTIISSRWLQSECSCKQVVNWLSHKNEF